MAAWLYRAIEAILDLTMNKNFSSERKGLIGEKDNLHCSGIEPEAGREGILMATTQVTTTPTMR